MANRRFNQFPLTLEHKVVMLDGYVDLNQSGAVINDRLLGASTERTGTGLYTTTFDDRYVELLSVSFSVISQTNAGLQAQVVRFKDSDGSESLAPVSVMNWKLVNKDGTPTDVTSGSAITISLRLKNSSV